MRCEVDGTLGVGCYSTLAKVVVCEGSPLAREKGVMLILSLEVRRSARGFGCY